MTAMKRLVGDCLELCQPSVLYLPHEQFLRNKVRTLAFSFIQSFSRGALEMGDI